MLLEIMPIVTKNIFLFVFFTLFTKTVVAQSPQLCFSAVSNLNALATGNYIYDIENADFNNDGNIDISFVNLLGNSVSILLGSPTGTFAPAVTYTVGTYPISLVSGDFNNDGKTDLAVAHNTGSINVSVMLGNGLGSFAVASYSFGLYPNGMICGDFNNDNNPDLAIACITNTISILLGSGNGNFSAPAGYTLSANASELVSGDFNTDGNKDIATCNYSTGNVSILLGSPNGSFATQSATYSVGSGPRAIICRDFNADGKKDLAIANSVSSNISVLMGSGTGTFASAVNYTVFQTPWSLTGDDFDGDGILDIATGNSASYNVSILKGTGNGGMIPFNDFLAGDFQFTIASADYNNDGRKDIASGANSINLLSNLGAGNFNGGINYPYPSDPQVITKGDFNNDGFQDCAIAGMNANSLSTLIGSGQGTFLSTNTFTYLGNNPGAICIASGDFNNDNNLDVAVGSFNFTNVSIFLGIGTGSLLPNVDYSVSAGTPHDIVCADLNNNGIPDLITADGANNISYFNGNGNGTFGISTFPAGQTPRVICVSDLNNDGWKDVIVNQAGQYLVAVLMNLGGTFSAPITHSVAGEALSIGSADLNGDGKTDLVISGNLPSHFISVSMGLGNGSFSAPTTYTSVGFTPRSIRIVDFNGDNNKDILVANTGDSKISVLRGSGTGTFSPAIHYQIGNYPTRVIDIDLNNDSRPDIIALSFPQKKVSVLLNGPALILSSANPICSGSSATIIATGANNYTWSTSATTNSIIVSPTISTTYSLIGMATSGCSNTAVKTISVSQGPPLLVNSGTICNGDSFTITPTGALTYTISGGNNIVTPTVNSTYSITGTDISGCASVVPAISNVTVNPLPLISVNSASICAGQSFSIIASGASTYTYSSGNSVVTPTINTSYSVTGTSLQGCTSSLSAVSNITVNATPTITANSGAICAGNSFTIIPSGASTYTYSSGISIVSPTTNTSYSVSGTNTAGCISSSVSISNVTVNALPILSVVSNNSIICQSQTAVLTATGANTYTWNTSSISASISVTPTVTTTYTVNGLDINGCQNVATITQIVSLCTGIAYENNNSGFNIYPNPTNGLLNIDLKNSNEPLKIEIYNSLGQLTFQEILTQSTVLNIKNLLNGIYTLNIQSNNTQLYRSTIIKQ